MELSDVLSAVTHIRNADEEITDIQLPIHMWRFLIDRLQELEDRDAARRRLTKLRQSQETQRTDGT